MIKNPQPEYPPPKQTFETDDERTVRLTDELETHDTAERAEFIKNLSIKEYLINRSSETTTIKIGGEKDIQIRSRLTKSDRRNHKHFLDRYNQSLKTGAAPIETDKDEMEYARFLSFVTVDESLDTDFWTSEDLDLGIADEIILAVLVTEPARQMADVAKFLGKRLRVGTERDAKSVGIQESERV